MSHQQPMHASSKEIPDFVKSLVPAGVSGTQILQEERAGSSINVQQLSEFLFGKPYLEKKVLIEKQLRDEPVFDKKNNYFDGRVDKFKQALARAKKFRQLEVKHDWSREDKTLAQSLIGEPNPYGLHAR